MFRRGFWGPRYGFGGGFLLPFTLGAVVGGGLNRPYPYYSPYPYYPYY